MEKNNLKSYSIKEHQEFDELKKKELAQLNLIFSDEKYLGLKSDFSVSYFIGIDWLEENKSYIAVHPKIKKLDYVEMFVKCLKIFFNSKHLKGVYHIYLDKPEITTSTSDWHITPFLVVHFLNLVEKIVKQGLKSNYIFKEENLNNKIKGKIVLSNQIKKNIVAKREDRIFCRYQEYSTNCPENRLLKKTLLFIQKYSKHFGGKYPELIQKQNRMLSYFDTVSDEINYSEIKGIKINSLYKEYKEAVELSKKLLRHFGYSIKNTEIKDEDRKKLPPFYINMAKLFELYVFSLLKNEYYEIKFQEKCKSQIPDFLLFSDDKKIIIDAKYKPKWKKEIQKEDILQLSGYARNEEILSELKIFKENSNKVVDDNFVVDCIIIYPDIYSNENLKDRDLKESKIENFTKFYKCGIRLPQKDLTI